MPLMSFTYVPPADQPRKVACGDRLFQPFRRLSEDIWSARPVAFTTLKPPSVRSTLQGGGKRRALNSAILIDLGYDSVEIPDLHRASIDVPLARRNSIRIGLAAFQDMHSNKVPLIID
jgi:hypothetical protein